VGHKKTHQNFFHHNLKKSDPILVGFGTNIPDATGYLSNDCLVSHLTHCLFLQYLGKENKQNIAFLTTSICLIKKHTKHTFCPYFYRFN